MTYNNVVRKSQVQGAAYVAFYSALIVQGVSEKNALYLTEV